MCFHFLLFFFPLNSLTLWLTLTKSFTFAWESLFTWSKSQFVIRSSICILLLFLFFRCLATDDVIFCFTFCDLFSDHKIILKLKILFPKAKMRERANCGLQKGLVLLFISLASLSFKSTCSLYACNQLKSLKSCHLHLLNFFPDFVQFGYSFAQVNSHFVSRGTHSTGPEIRPFHFDKKQVRLIWLIYFPLVVTVKCSFGCKWSCWKNLTVALQMQVKSAFCQLATSLMPIDLLIHPLQASYWMWTGDISPHDIWNITREEVIFQVRLVTEMIKQHAKVPVFPVIGNHEGVPVNRWVFNWISTLNTIPSSTWLTH